MQATYASSLFWPWRHFVSVVHLRAFDVFYAVVAKGRAIHDRLWGLAWGQLRLATKVTWSHFSLELKLPPVQPNILFGLPGWSDLALISLATCQSNPSDSITRRSKREEHAA